MGSIGLGIRLSLVAVAPEQLGDDIERLPSGRRCHRNRSPDPFLGRLFSKQLAFPARCDWYGS